MSGGVRRRTRRRRIEDGGGGNKRIKPLKVCQKIIQVVKRKMKVAK